MNDDRQALLDRVDQDRDRLIEFLCRFIRAKSPNPPGDTREAAPFPERPIRATLDVNSIFMPA